MPYSSGAKEVRFVSKCCSGEPPSILLCLWVTLEIKVVPISVQSVACIINPFNRGEGHMYGQRYYKSQIIFLCLARGLAGVGGRDCKG